MAVDAQTLLGLSTRLCCIGVLIQSLELLWNWRELRDGRLLAWATSPAPTPNPARRAVRALHGFVGTTSLLVLRTAAALVCIALPYRSGIVCLALGGLVLAQAYHNRRFNALRGNCDTISLVCLSGAWVGSLPGGSPRLQAAALGFIAFHSLLAYVMTGYDKVKSPLWRDGTRLTQILRDGNYRFPPLAEKLPRFPRTVWASSWAVILLELLFPLCLVLPSGGFWALVAGGAVFHALVAVTMGLHSFWWAFVATYPALYFLHAQLALWLQRAG